MAKKQDVKIDDLVIIKTITDNDDDLLRITMTKYLIF